MMTLPMEPFFKSFHVTMKVMNSMIRYLVKFSTNYFLAVDFSVTKLSF